MRRAAFATALLVTLLAIPAVAQHADSPLRVHRLFQDGMVLQRGVRVPVWGWATPGAVVRVALAANEATATADAQGAWSVHLPPLPAGGPHTLTVESGGRQLRVQDVLAGEVWVASGQSNMEWPLQSASNAAAVLPTARDPQLREFAVPHTYSSAPESDLAGGSWTSAAPATAGRFSAIAYFFARDLRAATGVPVGIIHTSWGGANIETWMSRTALGMTEAEWNAVMQQEQARDAAIRDTLRRRIGALPDRDEGMRDGMAVWADPALDDSGWHDVRVPALWESQGFPGLDGIAWYRLAFTLTQDEAAGAASLSLGPIDDDDITWLNGTEIGRTQGYAQPRMYPIAAGTLRPGRNVLAVRVSDGSGGGGLYGAAPAIYLGTAAGNRPLAGTWKLRVGQVSLQVDGQRINKVPTVLYNRMLHPLLRYPIAGVIWYQGESNANSVQQAAAYRQLFANLITGWRREWQGSHPEFPFLWVQLPGYGRVDDSPPANAGWATLREAQAAALALPRTGQAVAIDVGDPADIHPRNKQPVGERLALLARRLAYGHDVQDNGPVYRRHSVQGGEIRIEFTAPAGLQLRAAAGQPNGFAVAGEDRRWVWAEARVEGGNVIVSSPQVPHPVAVRYAWSNSPARAALFGANGLPAAPFRTDVW